MKDLIERALKVMESEFVAGDGKYNATKLTKDYCRLQLGAEKEEVFGVMFMNNHFELLSFDKLFRGSVAESNVHPRAIARRMFELNASKMVLVHNHPSGHCEPSASDLEVTESFKKLFKQLDCDVVDHIIVSAVSSYSMAEEGRL